MRRQSLPFGVLQRIPAAALFLLAPQHPEWRTTPPFDAILKGRHEGGCGIGGN